MKFSEIGPDDWPALQPYLDTCLLPVSGLAGDEAPWEQADKAAATGAWLAPLERAFHGRTVTMPAFHYCDRDGGDAERLRQLCLRLKRGGFRFVIAVCGHPATLPDDLPADLIVQPAEAGAEPDETGMRNAVAALWSRKTAAE